MLNGRSGPDCCLTLADRPVAGFAEFRKFKNKGPVSAGPLFLCSSRHEEREGEWMGGPIRCGTINAIALATLARRAMLNGFPEGALVVECRGAGRRRPGKAGGAGR